MVSAGDLSVPAVFAVIGIAGFAVQRAVELLDPFVALLIRKTRSSPPLDPWETELKKVVLLLLSLGLALVIVQITEVRLLSLIPELSDVWESGDFVVTALVLSAGTESVNSLQKYLGYVKDAQKPNVISLAVKPSSAKIKPSTTAKFIAVVGNSANKAVEWKVLSGGGSIDANGTFTAGGTSGQAQIGAVSTADPSAVGIATVQIM